METAPELRIAGAEAKSAPTTPPGGAIYSLRL
jgi:hypothetical protein